MIVVAISGILAAVAFRLNTTHQEGQVCEVTQATQAIEVCGEVCVQDQAALALTTLTLVCAAGSNGVPATLVP